MNVVQLFLVNRVFDSFDWKSKPNELFNHIGTFAPKLGLIFVELRQLILHRTIPSRVLDIRNVHTLPWILDEQSAN